MTAPDAAVPVIPGKLRVGPDGRLAGPASISYNDPWPCANGTPGGGSPLMMGVVLHTEAGYEQPTIQWFNNPASQASAFFAIGRDGAVWQFGPAGQDWMAWTQAAGNPMWYGIEDADNAHPSIPLTAAQVTAFAQVLECLSAFAGFPLQVTDSTAVRGLGVHSMGGVPWGDHPDCPGPVRAAQRAAIVALARLIRDPPRPGTEQTVPGGAWTRLAGTDAEVLVPVTVRLRVRPA